LATKRTRAIYKAKGYSDDWIEKRMRSIAIRDELTDEWKKRGVKEQREYAILLIRRWVGRQTTVAQIVNLPYRRLAVGGLRYLASRVCLGETRRLPTCDTADCQSALLICRPLRVGHPADSSVTAEISQATFGLTPSEYAESSAARITSR
jgi:hypothetical protein